MYCQKCGFQLAQIKLCVPLWIAFYQCKNCSQSYLEVADMRWIFPFQFLEGESLEKALAVSDEQLAGAAQIKMIDY